MPNRNRQRGNFADDTDGRRDRKDRNRERIDRARERDRIEARRDRRQDRRERNRDRRDVVETYRSAKEDLRVDRLGSRLMPIEDSFLGQPVGVPTDLPVLIGERWNRTTDQSISHDTWTTILYDAAAFTTERNGYPVIYTASSGTWRIPAGLAGIWMVSTLVRWTETAASTPEIRFFLNGATEIAQTRLVANGGPVSMSLNTVYKFQEADEFTIDFRHFQGVSDDILSGSAQSWTWAFAHFLGK